MKEKIKFERKQIMDDKFQKWKKILKHYLYYQFIITK